MPLVGMEMNFFVIPIISLKIQNLWRIIWLIISLEKQNKYTIGKWYLNNFEITFLAEIKGAKKTEFPLL